MTRIVKILEDRGETVFAEINLVSARHYPALQRVSVPKSVIGADGEIAEWWVRAYVE